METESNLQIICLETQVFYALVEQVISKLESSSKVDPKWIDDEEVMHLLKIMSKTTLQKTRDEGKIRYSQEGRKMIFYDRESIKE